MDGEENGRKVSVVGVDAVIPPPNSRSQWAEYPSQYRDKLSVSCLQEIENRYFGVATATRRDIDWHVIRPIGKIRDIMIILRRRICNCRNAIYCLLEAYQSAVGVLESIEMRGDDAIWLLR